METLVGSDTLEFGNFRFDRLARELARRNATGDWESVALGSRAGEILAVLTAKPGEVVSRDTIMDAVWPGIAVEPNNMTVQMATVRRVLDEGRTGESCIQTIVGRGYRFLPIVTSNEWGRPPPAPRVMLEEAEESAETVAAPTYGTSVDAPGPDPRRRAPLLLVLSALVLAGLSMAALALSWIGAGDRTTPRPAPRLSLVVLPFENLSGDASRDYLVDGITEDLTTDLANVPGLLVIAHNSAFSYKGKPIVIKQVGEELGVRYALQGSVRQVGSALRVNVRLVSTETGAELTADRFDADVGGAAPDQGTGQDEIVNRIARAMNIQLVNIESARGARERSANPDALDLLLRARALYLLPPNPERRTEAIALLERAVQLDPYSAKALVSLASLLLDELTETDDPRAPATFDRAEALLAKAEGLPRQPGYDGVMATRGFLLRYEGRCSEAVTVLRTMIDAYPNAELGHYQLGVCLMVLGRPAEAMPQFEQAIRLDPRSPWINGFYRRMGEASLLLGRYDDAVSWERRSIAADLGAGAEFLAHRYLWIAAAHALAGRLEDARGAAAEARRLMPTTTLRGWPTSMWTSWHSTVWLAQLAQVREGLRLAGVRDHADEDADHGVAADNVLHMRDVGWTPIAAPGARTIRTADLPMFLEQRKPLVLDVNAWGRSIPGAIGLRGAGVGGSTSDPSQTRLDHEMRELTHGDLTMPVVTMGWNADSFSGRNLALRLVGLGYREVVWYRGGREAWEVAGLPEVSVVSQAW